MEKAENTIELSYSLKRQALKIWIYERNLTQSYVAIRLKMSVQELKRKLKKRELFSYKQITDLVFMMGAREALKVIYFPTKEEKRLVSKITFCPKEVK